MGFLHGRYGVIVPNHAALEHQLERERVTTLPRKDSGLTVSESVHRVNHVIHRIVQRRRRKHRPPSLQLPPQHAQLLLLVTMEKLTVHMQLSIDSVSVNRSFLKVSTMFGAKGFFNKLP